MVQVKIYGAGSIGNHLAYACREQQWDVVVCDTDTQALQRMASQIYPSRYGAWDPCIQLKTYSEAKNNQHYDIVFVGTPPDSHIPLAIEAINDHSPQILMIEKPLCDTSLENCDLLNQLMTTNDIFIGVGYNHLLSPNTIAAKNMIQKYCKDPQTLSVNWNEHWGGIFQAHPWLDGPESSYLGYSDRGGGACGEHSHGINLWLYLTCILQAGHVTELSCMMDISTQTCNYDKITQINLKTENGLVGHVTQDVVTHPAIKKARIQACNGHLEWSIDTTASCDLISCSFDDTCVDECFPKNRSDDFKWEIQHISSLLNNPYHHLDSPLHLKFGLQTMMIIAAAHISHKNNSTVRINWEAGYNNNAFELLNSQPIT